jgi:hypothetical protein
MDDRLQEAIAEIRSGNPQAGYHLLTEVIRANPRGRDAEAAWLLMSIIVADPEKKRQSLEAVLLLNPDNENAKERLAKLDSLTETVETSQTRETQQSRKSSGIGQDVRDVGKTRAGVAPGTLSTRVVALILSLILLAVCCGSCLFLGTFGPGNWFSNSLPSTDTIDLPATYTPVSGSIRQPERQSYMGFGRAVEQVRVPDGYDIMRVVMIGNGFSYFEVWSENDDLLMDGGCDGEQCLATNQISLSGVGDRVEIVFNAVEYFGSLDDEAWSAEVSFIEQ